MNFIKSSIILGLLVLAACKGFVDRRNVNLKPDQEIDGVGKVAEVSAIIPFQTNDPTGNRKCQASSAPGAIGGVVCGAPENACGCSQDPDDARKGMCLYEIIGESSTEVVEGSNPLQSCLGLVIASKLEVLEAPVGQTFIGSCDNTDFDTYPFPRVSGVNCCDHEKPSKGLMGRTDWNQPVVAVCFVQGTVEFYHTVNCVAEPE